MLFLKKLLLIYNIFFHKLIFCPVSMQSVSRFKSLNKQIWKHFSMRIRNTREGSRGAMAKVLSYSHEVSEFESQWSYQIHFKTNSILNVYVSLIKETKPEKLVCFSHEKCWDPNFYNMITMKSIKEINILHIQVKTNTFGEFGHQRTPIPLFKHLSSIVSFIILFCRPFAYRSAYRQR